MGAGHRGGGWGAAGDGVVGRGAADRGVLALAGAFAVVEYELARRMHAASLCGGRCRWWVRGRCWVPAGGPVRTPAGWPGPGRWPPSTRRWPGAWGAGIITSDHVDAVARNVGPLEPDELAAVIEELSVLWGQLSPQAVAAFVARVIRLLHPTPRPRLGGGRGL